MRVEASRPTGPATGMPGHRRARTAAGRARATLLVAVAACGSAGDGGRDAVTVRDSAGIRIVESRAPAWRAGEAWRVVEPPLVEIGLAQGESAYEMFDVRGALRLSDGRMVVLNAGTRELRWYDAAGRHLMTAGGRGGGPGEFNSPGFMARLPGDSILAFDRQPPRASIFDPAGAFVRDVAFPQPPSRRSWVSFEVTGLLDAYRLVVWSQPIYGSGYHAFPDGMNRLPHPIGVGDLEAARFDSIATAPGWDVWVEQRSDGSAQMAAPPFARSSDVVATGNEIFIAATDAVAVHVLDAQGRLTRIVRAAHRPVPIRPADWDAWVADLTELFPNLTPAQRAEGDRLLAVMPVPATMPAFRGLDVDRAGNLWLHDYPRPGLVSPGARVFDQEGRWLGSVMLPPGIKRDFSREPLSFDIGDDWILGVWTDAMGVEYVRLYRLEKPGG